MCDEPDFIRCYNPENRHERRETWSEDRPEGRWRRLTYEEILARDKVSLDIFWLCDESLGDMDNISEPEEMDRCRLKDRLRLRGRLDHSSDDRLVALRRQGASPACRAVPGVSGGGCSCTATCPPCK